MAVAASQQQSSSRSSCSESMAAAAGDSYCGGIAVPSMGCAQLQLPVPLQLQASRGVMVHQFLFTGFWSGGGRY